MNTSKKIISLLMCMLMVLTMVPMSVFATVGPIEIDTVHIEGLPAPLYGQTVEEYYTAILDERGGGTLTVNDETFNKSAGKYGNLFDEGLEVKKNDTVLNSTSTELITEGTYYVAMTLYPADGYAFADDVAVTVDGAVSVEKDFDEYGSLIAYAEYEVKATEIDTVHIEGIPAPVYGQTVKEYNTVMYNGSMDGTHKINGSTRVNNGEDVFYGNIELGDWEYYNSEKSYIAPSSADALPSVYYLVHWLYPAAGYKFPDDDPVTVNVDGAVSVESELDEDGCLTVWAKFEIKPTEIDTINIEGIPAPLYGQVSKDYLDDVIAKVKVNNELYDSKNQAFGNLNVEWQTICDSTKTMLSSSETFSEGTYYYLLELYPKTGFVFADIDDISASVNGNASVELEASTVYDDTVLVWVKFEVAPPTVIDTINVEGVPAPLYGQTPKDYLDDVIAKVKVNNEPYDSTNQAFGNLNVEWEAIFDSTKTNSLLSSSEILTAGTYYYLLELYPKTGFVFADIDDISASVNGNASVELEASTVYDDTVLVWVKFEVKCSHVYDNACDATCNKCESTRTPAAHTGGTATCTTKAKCSVCGEAYGSLKAHSYKTVTTKATLTKNGKVESKCSCGAVKSGSTKTVYYPKTIKLEYTSATYNGKTKTPSVTVKDYKGNTLKKDTDYTVKYASGRKSTGKYSVTITFKGKYSGTKTLYFNILPSKTSKITLTCSTTEIKATWKSVTGASGYKVELLNSKGKVVKKVTTTKTYYTFKKLSKVTTYKIRVTAYKTIDKKAVYSGVSTTITTSTAPAKVTLSKVTAGSKSATPAWKTVSGASGYQVQYSTSSKFKSAKTATVSKGSSKKTTIKKLTKGKKYYFKVRAYKTVGSTKVYGSWSAVKSVKVK